MTVVVVADALGILRLLHVEFRPVIRHCLCKFKLFALFLTATLLILLLTPMETIIYLFNILFYLVSH